MHVPPRFVRSRRPRRSPRLPRRSPGLAAAVPALVALAPFVAACGADAPPIPTGPNVILISIDTLRPDFLGCYGYDRGVSPTIDSVAAAGTVFEDVTSAAPWTLPSHASMLTGLYPVTHGVKNHDRQLTAETLAMRFSDAGYRTYAVVNTHNIGFPQYGLLRGFQGNEYVVELEDLPDGKQFIGNQGGKITRKGVKWLREGGDRPFFLFLHYYDVHTDFTPKAKWKLEYVEPYTGKLNGSTGQLVGYRHREKSLTEEDVRWLKQMYDAEIRTLDEVLARLFDYLDASGVGEDTLVVITSDHGEEYYEHGGVLHGRTMYQELLAIPLILRGPGVPAGLRIEEPVHLVDVAPTILSLAGLAPFEKADGMDLSAFWRDRSDLPELRFLFGEADHNNEIDGEDVVDIKAMVRIRNDKLLYDKHTKQRELYDVAADPGEQDDRAAADPERLDFLWAELQRFMASEGGGVEIAPPTPDTVELLEKLGY